MLALMVAAVKVIEFSGPRQKLVDFTWRSFQAVACPSCLL